MHPTNETSTKNANGQNYQGFFVKYFTKHNNSPSNNFEDLADSDTIFFEPYNY
jgi:hypothetical protein